VLLGVDGREHIDTVLASRGALRLARTARPGSFGGRRSLGRGFCFFFFSTTRGATSAEVAAARRNADAVSGSASCLVASTKLLSDARLPTWMPCFLTAGSCTEAAARGDRVCGVAGYV